MTDEERGDASTNHGMPRIASNTGSKERGKKQIPLWSLQREYGSADTIISDFYPPGVENKFLLF